MEEKHSIECFCEALETEKDTGAFGTKCKCLSNIIKDDNVYSIVELVTMVDLHKVDKLEELGI